MGAAQNQGISSQINIQHPELNKTYAFTSPTGKALLVSISSQQSIYKNWNQQVQLFLSKNLSQEFLLLPLESNYTEGGVCSTSGQVGIRYEYYPKLLTTQMIARKQQLKRYSQAQLWYILFAIVFAKVELAKDSFLVGDIHPNNIFLNEQKNIKVANMLSWPMESNNYKKALIQQKITYLAPQDLERLNLGSTDNNMNYQSQIFSIGLVLLGCASLTFHEDLYFMQTHQFQQDYFFLRLGKFQQQKQYSQILRGIISNLLQIQPSKRLSLQDLQQFLTKHKDNILNRKALFIDNVPKRLQLTINNMIKAIANDTKEVLNNKTDINSPSLQIQSIVQHVNSSKEDHSIANIGLNSIKQIQNQDKQSPNTNKLNTSLKRSRGSPINTVNLFNGFQQIVHSPKNVSHIMRDVKSLEHIVNVNHPGNEIRIKSPSNINHHTPIIMNQPPRPNTQPPFNNPLQQKQQQINYNKPHLPYKSHQAYQQQQHQSNFPPINQHVQIRSVSNSKNIKQQYTQNKIPKINFINKSSEQQRKTNPPIVLQQAPLNPLSQEANYSQKPSNQVNHNQRLLSNSINHPPLHQGIYHQQTHLNQGINQTANNQPALHQTPLYQQIPSQINNNHKMMHNNSNNAQMNNNLIQQPNKSNEQVSRPQQMKNMMQIRRSGARSTSQSKNTQNIIKQHPQKAQNIINHPPISPNLIENQHDRLRNIKQIQPFTNISKNSPNSQMSPKKKQTSQQTGHATSKQAPKLKTQLLKMQQLIKALQKQEYFDEQIRQIFLNHDKIVKNNNDNNEISQGQRQNHEQNNNQSYQKQINVLNINSTITQRQFENSTEQNHQSNHLSQMSNEQSQINHLRQFLYASNKNPTNNRHIKIQQPNHQQYSRQQQEQIKQQQQQYKQQTQYKQQLQSELNHKKVQQKLQKLQQALNKNLNQRSQSAIKSTNSIKLDSTQLIKSPQKPSQYKISSLQINSKPTLQPSPTNIPSPTSNTNLPSPTSNNNLPPQTIKQQFTQQRQGQSQFENKKIQMIQTFKLQLTKKYNNIQIIDINKNSNAVNKSSKISPLVKVWGMNNGQSNNKSGEIHNQSSSSEVKQTVSLKQVDKDRNSKKQENSKRANQAGKEEEGQNKKVFEQIKNMLNIAQKDVSDQKNRDNSHANKQERRVMLQANNEPSSNIKTTENKYHTYADLSTNGTLDQCWQQLIQFLKDPSAYSALIHPHKVISRSQFLKVGPSCFKVHLNEQQGKIMLQNTSQSKCRGSILCGLFKDDDKQYKIWVNSACYYKDKQFPSRQLIGELLFKVKQNISKNSHLKK